MKWDAAQYLKFESERTQPSVDLTARLLLKNPKRILDIGCGPGNSTRLLKNKYPDAAVLGIDKSPEMIETARRNHPDIEFEVRDAGNDLKEIGGGFDIVFSNAAIQWIPNHEKLIPEMMNLLNPCGFLAVQTPMNQNATVNEIIKDLRSKTEWQNKFTFSRVFYNLTPNQYYDILSKISSDFTIWETIYYHKMDSQEDILEWYRGTGLRPYLEQLTDEESEAFEKEIRTLLDTEYLNKNGDYSKQSDGTILMKFPRLFFTAQKREENDRN